MVVSHLLYFGTMDRALLTRSETTELGQSGVEGGQNPQSPFIS